MLVTHVVRRAGGRKRPREAPVGGGRIAVAALSVTTVGTTKTIGVDVVQAAAVGKRHRAAGQQVDHRRAEGVAAGSGYRRGHHRRAATTATRRCGGRAGAAGVEPQGQNGDGQRRNNAERELHDIPLGDTAARITGSSGLWPGDCPPLNGDTREVATR